MSFETESLARNFVVGRDTLTRYADHLRNNGIDWTPKHFDCEKTLSLCQRLDNEMHDCDRHSDKLWKENWTIVCTRHFKRYHSAENDYRCKSLQDLLIPKTINPHEITDVTDIADFDRV